MPDELARLVARIPQIAGNGDGIGSAEDRLATQIQRYGVQAVPLLLPLLKHSRYGVRQLTGYTICDIEGMKDSSLDALIAADRRESGWLPPAIARIGSARAIVYLAEQLQRQPDPDSQIGLAFGILDTKGVPALCHLLRSAAGKGKALQDAIAAILYQLSPEAKRLSVAPLLTIALDKHLPNPCRQGALTALGSLGQPAVRAVPAIRQLADAEPSVFRETVNSTLLQLRVADAVPELVSKLTQKGATNEAIAGTLGGLASLSTNGVAAGAVVVPYLNHPDWEVRVAAAWAAGCIGYRKAIPDLISLLDNTEDWRLVWVAVDSLGRLRANEAANALQRTRVYHWYPPVRENAALALTHIQGKTPPAAPVTRRGRTHTGARSSIIFVFDRIARANRITPAPAITASNRLTVPEGEFIGTDRGEWGGDLTFVAKHGAKQVILSENVHALVRLGANIIAITGLAHMGSNRGVLYRTVRDATGVWKAEPWRVLPGAPEWSAIQNGGASLWVACLGGTIQVEPEGKISFIG